MKFFICNHCGNIIQYMVNKGVPVMCCGEKMHELVPCTTDGATEKHIPVVYVDGNIVTCDHRRQRGADHGDAVYSG